MKKNILIAFLLLITLSSYVYANLKASEAEKNGQEARLAQIEAQEQAERAKQQAELAMASATEAIAQQKEAERLMEELLKCKK